MTNQEVFDKAVKHLLTQKKKSTKGPDSSICRYRGHNGLKCAVGGLIPDALYQKNMESLSVQGLFFGNDYPEIQSLFEGVNMNLLKQLQRIHDLNPVRKWKERLVNAAKKYNLDYSHNRLLN